jgi:hypothetical protein
MIKEISIIKELYKILNSYYSNLYYVDIYYSNNYVSFKTDKVNLIFQKNTTPIIGKYANQNIVFGLSNTQEIVSNLFYNSSRVDYKNLKYISKTIDMIKKEIIERKYLQ